jgi:hypothetical protein
MFVATQQYPLIYPKETEGAVDCGSQLVDFYTQPGLETPQSFRQIVHRSL